MSNPPLVIWTFRRTGGTALAGLIGKTSDSPRFFHEPFNADRKMGWITKQFEADQDVKALGVNLREEFSDRPCLKHCYDLLPPKLHNQLLFRTNKLDYSQVVLDRKDDLDRVLSLLLAMQTGAWGPTRAKDIYPAILDGSVSVAPIDPDQVREQMEHGLKRRTHLIKRMAHLGIVPHVVFFEDIYGPGADGAAVVGAMLADIGIDPSGNPDYPALLEETLVRKSQNSAKILELVPNISELRERFSEAAMGENPWLAMQSKASH